MVPEAGLVWRGFHHAWRYNHRLNRLASYLAWTGGDWECVHAAASGTGPDTAQFCDLYTLIEDPDVAFQSVTEPFEVTGDENVSHTVSRTLTIDLESELQGRDTIEVVLNGFDIAAASDADKLQKLHLSVGEPTESADGTSLDVPVEVTFQGDCGTPECREDGVDYGVDVRYLVVAGDDSTVRSGSTVSAGSDYTWDRSQEPDHKADGLARASITDPDRWTGDSVENALGFTELQVDLTKTGDPALIAAVGELADHAEGMHFLELDASIESITADNGTLDAAFLLFYKNWERGMKQLVPPDFLQTITDFIPDDTESAIRNDPDLSWTDVIDASILAHRSAGRADIDATARLLQFDDPERFHHNAVPGDVDWEGENADPNSDDAVQRTLIE
ncbi:hypothetical protein Huta_1287 [Halorhabdus utahensis DSM 12940]|uniref:Uncharacterized protein n=1 Tax=Halorhabdus utahensis (strain DSM 12940 / JCM 11049 / AX-2) TaxID=519442 RepID=C7NN63_HALUD|nr:hypothetical protein [Halorhabdus utahensis]ACV11463.1 hypothetical protein Huta_1287 [Halorhabdus utahensis DSM 12940]